MMESALNIELVEGAEESKDFKIWTVNILQEIVSFIIDNLIWMKDFCPAEVVLYLYGS